MAFSLLDVRLQRDIRFLKEAFGSLDVWLQRDVRFLKGAFGSLDVRFLEFLIPGITSWEYKITVFGSLVIFQWDSLNVSFLCLIGWFTILIKKNYELIKII